MSHERIEIPFSKRLENIDYDGEIPDLFFCIFKYNVMDDPVSFLCEHTYDRASIIELFRRNNFPRYVPCPLSRRPIAGIELIKESNLEIKDQIKLFVEEQERLYLQSHPHANIELYMPISNHLSIPTLLPPELLPPYNSITNLENFPYNNSLGFFPPTPSVLTTITQNRNRAPQSSHNSLKELFAIVKILSVGILTGTSIGTLGSMIANLIPFGNIQNQFEDVVMATVVGLCITCVAIGIIGAYYKEISLNDWVNQIIQQFLVMDNRIITIISLALFIIPPSSALGALLLENYDQTGINGMTLLEYVGVGILGVLPIGWQIIPVTVLLSVAVIAKLESYCEERLANYNTAENIPHTIGLEP